MKRFRLAALLVAAVVPVEAAWALEYPCPADPGFCYRDFADDGCFDPGVDDGPINAEIEASSTFPPIPPAGSIVCPPSVKVLTATSLNLRLATSAGSSILIYAAKVVVPEEFETISGDRLLIGGPVFGGAGVLTQEAAGEIHLGGDWKLEIKSFPSDLVLDSQSGDVVVGPDVGIKASKVSFLAPAGNVELLDGVVFMGHNAADLRISAGGTVAMTQPRFVCSQMLVEGGDVVVHGKARISSVLTNEANDIEIAAAPGDVTIDRLLLTTKAGVEISGTNVTIGELGPSGTVPRSKLTLQDLGFVDILASDAIRLENLRLSSSADVRIETTGATVDVLESTLVGRKTAPVFEIAAGPGSTCNLTGTSVKKATLVTDCDTVLGP